MKPLSRLSLRVWSSVTRKLGLGISNTSGEALDGLLEQVEFAYGKLLKSEFPALNSSEVSWVLAVLAVLKTPMRSRSMDRVLELCRQALSEVGRLSADAPDQEVSK
ncbi:MAG: hypothetical protein L0387_07215 [Acidobacteria bacterium]|nr:hypothetical protein [Acidobacteriota bacterium]MCI0722437.1 hypothetical protein [Acidobacteriota bacterium]